MAEWTTHPDDELSMKEIDRIWAESVPSDYGTFEPLPDGSYEVEIIEARLEHSKAGRLQFTMAMAVTAGSPFAGRYIYKFTSLDNEIGIRILKDDQQILKFGRQEMNKDGETRIDLYPPSEIAEHTGELIGAIVKVSLKTKTARDGNSYQNCYLNRLILAPTDPMEEPIF